MASLAVAGASWHGHRVLFLAMSCFQGRPQDLAWEALRALAPDGIQLTPGNLPSPGFRARVEAAGVPVRMHHGFAWHAPRQEVHDTGGGPRLGGPCWSVHPPPSFVDRRALARWLEDAAARGIVVETMTPGLPLGDGPDLALALDAGVSLAVDVSHLHIQRVQGAISGADEQRVLASPRVAEVHVSDNDGRSDQHRLIDARTPGLAWAVERARSGTPLVLEAYLHRLDPGARARQVQSIREALA